MTQAEQHIRRAGRIVAFRDLVRQVRASAPARGGLSRRMVRLLRMVGPALVTLAELARPVRHHDWAVFYDGTRVAMRPGETAHGFLNRIGRLNRPGRLPAFLGIEPDSPIVLVDVACGLGRSGPARGALGYLLALTGPVGMIWLAASVLWTWRRTARLEHGVIAAGLAVVAQRHQRTRTGVLLLTSVSWMAETARVGFAAARVDLRVVEVLHGAGTQNTAPYFQWVHAEAAARLEYINLIADLPRYAPLDAHLVTDEAGEIACNIRFWAERPDPRIQIAAADLAEPSIAFIGGASLDPDYFASPYFEQERTMMALLHESGRVRIRYCPHPQHSPAVLDAVRPVLAGMGAEICRDGTITNMIRSTIVVGGFSTSLMEAALLGRKVFSYQDLGTLFIPEIAALQSYTTDQEALCRAAVAALAEGAAVPPTQRAAQVQALARQRYGIVVEFT